MLKATAGVSERLAMLHFSLRMLHVVVRGVSQFCRRVQKLKFWLVSVQFRKPYGRSTWNQINASSGFLAWLFGDHAIVQESIRACLFVMLQRKLCWKLVYKPTAPEVPGSSQRDFQIQVPPILGGRVWACWHLDAATHPSLVTHLFWKWQRVSLERGACSLRTIMR